MLILHFEGLPLLVQVQLEILELFLDLNEESIPARLHAIGFDTQHLGGLSFLLLQLLLPMGKVLDGHPRFFILITKSDPLLGEAFDRIFILVQSDLPPFQPAADVALIAAHIVIQINDNFAQLGMLACQRLDAGLSLHHTVAQQGHALSDWLDAPIQFDE